MIAFQREQQIGRALRGGFGGRGLLLAGAAGEQQGRLALRPSAREFAREFFDGLRVSGVVALFQKLIGEQAETPVCQDWRDAMSSRNSDRCVSLYQLRDLDRIERGTLQ